MTQQTSHIHIQNTRGAVGNKNAQTLQALVYVISLA